jgi:hypothetical protein
VALAWREALWGLEHQLLDRPTIVELAIDRLIEGSDNPIEVELAALQKSELPEAGDLLRRLAETEPALSEAEIARKWLFLRMALIYEDKKSPGDRLAEAESAYADFGYPREVEGFIRYMPADSSYDPRSHTPEENEARLLRMWKQYLDASACEFVKHHVRI